MAVGLGAAAIVITGCQSTGVKTKADSSTAQTGKTTEAAKPSTSGTSKAATAKSTAPKSTAAKPAHVKATITLGGNNAPGEKVAVTVVKVVERTTASDGFSKPAKGKRFAAVQFRLHNVGKSSYQDSPGNGAKVLDSQGQSYPSYIVGDVAAGPSFANGSVNIAPGETQLGYVAFQVPTTFKISKVQFGTDSGFGQTGEWINP